MIPRTRSAVVAFSNRDDATPYDLVDGIVALLGKTHRPAPPKVAGSPAKEVAAELFSQLQAGHVDRARYGDDFNAFLTDAMIHAASAHLGPLGAPTDVEVVEARERGGMELTKVDFTFATAKLQAVMYRNVDGHVEQFLVNKR
jgi:hypothetical protein